MKKLFSVLSIVLAVTFLIPAINVSASTNWSVDVSNPPWTPTSEVNIVGNGVWDGNVTVAGTSATWDFKVKYKQWVADLELDYIDKVPDTAGHYGDCPQGYSVDLQNQAVCRKLVCEGHEDCTLTCPSKTFADTRSICPVGYGSNPGHDNCRKFVDECPTDPAAYTHTSQGNRTCKMWKNNQWMWTDKGYYVYADKILDTFGPIQFSYDKWDQDPHKCHLPTAESLDVPSWAESDFNKFPEWLDADEDCDWVDPVYDYVDRPWVDGTYKCPEGYTEDPQIPDQCRKQVDEGGWIYETLEFNGKKGFVNPPKPACPTCGDPVDELVPDGGCAINYCRADTPVWNSTKWGWEYPVAMSFVCHDSTAALLIGKTVYRPVEVQSEQPGKWYRLDFDPGTYAGSLLVVKGGVPDDLYTQWQTTQSIVSTQFLSTDPLNVWHACSVLPSGGSRVNGKAHMFACENTSEWAYYIVYWYWGATLEKDGEVNIAKAFTDANAWAVTLESKDATGHIIYIDQDLPPKPSYLK